MKKTNQFEIIELEHEINYSVFIKIEYFKKYQIIVESNKFRVQIILNNSLEIVSELIQNVSVWMDETLRNYPLDIATRTKNKKVQNKN